MSSGVLTFDSFDPEPEKAGVKGAPEVIFDPQTVKLAATMKLLSDANRLMIVRILQQSGEMNVTDLCTRVGQSQPALSHHLSLLRTAGVLVPRRAGKHNFYRIAEHGLKCFQEICALLQPKTATHDQNLVIESASTDTPTS